MTDLLTEADASARAAAQRSGVEIRELSDVADLTLAEGLFNEVWHAEPGHSHLSAEIMRACAIAGLYVTGAYDETGMVAACVGFVESPERRSLHSHIAGVVAAASGRDIGFAVKLHQRAWALSRGLDAIAWTFDPLVRRNAFFNLAKLGATVKRYVPDFYGSMHDGINRGDASDRIYVRWELLSPTVIACCGEGVGGGVRVAMPSVRAEFADAPVVLRADGDERPVASPSPDAPRVVVGLPADVERLRGQDPSAAWEWRLALRAALQAELATGGRIADFDRERGYLIERGETR